MSGRKMAAMRAPSLLMISKENEKNRAVTSRNIKRIILTRGRLVLRIQTGRANENPAKKVLGGLTRQRKVWKNFSQASG